MFQSIVGRGHCIEILSKQVERDTLLQEELNASDDAWQQLSEESDPVVLSGLLWDWLNHLKVLIPG